MTLAAVAERAGVAVPSLYKHVGGLDDLRRRIATESVRALDEVVAEANSGLAATSRSGTGSADTDDGSGAAALRALARGIRSFALAHPGRYAAVQFAPTQLRDGAAGDGSAAGDALAAAAAALLGRLDDALRAQGLPEACLVDGVRLLRSSVHGFVALEQGGGFGLPDDLDRSFDVVVEAMVAGVERLRGASAISR
ncbi:TetR/AcrR family transcriptional regulator [Agromyces sp. CFH 90414]|uniref:TetR/AcrR family transcriptional regulator n=1 Tax=Agromyces agglutinans TaxID=2662258 RepID=A0A6I2FAS2_9MICO|nr:TetR/AcrR family transcriptional regulator [Agromyces agglutinans]